MQQSDTSLQRELTRDAASTRRSAEAQPRDLPGNRRRGAEPSNGSEPGSDANRPCHATASRDRQLASRRAQLIPSFKAKRRPQADRCACRNDRDVRHVPRRLRSRRYLVPMTALDERDAADRTPASSLRPCRQQAAALVASGTAGAIRLAKSGAWVRSRATRPRCYGRRAENVLRSWPVSLM